MTVEVLNSSSNPLLQQEGLPKFGAITAEHLTPAVDILLETLETEFAALEASLSSSVTAAAGTSNSSNSTTVAVTTYDDVVPVLERLQARVEYAWGVAGHLNGVQNSNDLRTAYEANQPRIVQVTSQITQSRVMYAALQAIQQQQQHLTATATTATDDDSELSGQKRRAVELSLRSMTLGGVGLEGAAKERFNEIKQRLAALKTSFSNHVLDATKAYHLTVTEASQLAGVPESALSMWAAAHQKATAAAAAAAADLTEEGSAAAAAPPLAVVADNCATDTATTGPWRITLDMPSYMAVQSHVRDRSIREAVYRAYVTRASELVGDDGDGTVVSDSLAGGDGIIHTNNNNVPLIYEILQLKQEQAGLLGFANFAELSLASKMAPSVQAVTALSDLIGAQALPAAEAELAEMTALAAQQTDDGSPIVTTILEPWDVKFWTERLKESKFELTEEETRPYFALPAVLTGMFALVQRLFEVEVQAADGEAEIWHPDVRFFKVFDAAAAAPAAASDGGRNHHHIASFYLDPYSRPENKRGGAWMGSCIGKSAACGRDVAVAYLTCNGSPPVGDKPSLMTFREVETLFHEFGHGLQHMLTRVTTGDVAGINGIEWDAVELPSQFMENWCYDRPTVYGFAKHWETGEPMPEAIFEKLKAQKSYNAGMMSCRQLLYGQVDMELHSNYDAAKGAKCEGESIFDVQRRIAKKYTPFSMPIPEDRFLCAFSHIFAGGYAAGYYSYKWAEVMSADAFSAFEDVGLDNEEEVKKVGMKFRETVMSLGGGKDPMTVFKAFRGREPSPEALLRHNGLA